jgi:stage II sporulation protein P
MLNPDGLDFNKSDVIIFHTHTCESYTPTEAFSYEESGTFRTTDLNYSVSRVGDSLSEQLTSYGFNVTHDKTYHDYPAYSGSYGRSMSTVQGILNNQPNSDIIIDLHRDAIADTSYAPSVQIGDEIASQLMFVIGTDGGGLEHPNWQQNLKFAISIQKKANELYPGLFRSILIRNSRYNQQLGKAACIIEVGATGNTLEQSMTSMKYLAKVFDEVLKK